MEWKNCAEKFRFRRISSFYQYCILDCGGAWAVWNTAACGLCFYGNVTGVQYQYYFIDIFTG